MAEQFLHGVTLLELTDGIRPVSTVKSSVVGIVGTAPFADAAIFPLDTPVLVTGKVKAAKLDSGETPETTDRGTLPDALKAIYDQTGASVVVIRVEVGADDAATQTNIIGGVDGVTGALSGLEALRSANQLCHVEPRIILAPYWSENAAVSAQLLVIAGKLKAKALIDCPNGTDDEAITYRDTFASKRAICCYPHVMAWDSLQSANTARPLSSYIAGVMVWTDNNLGFWHSPSNKDINGITGLSKPVDYRLSDPDCTANKLNENEIVTVKADKGFKTWGNRTCSDDVKYAFISVSRTADLIDDSVLAAHQWAVDENITATYFEDVKGGVNAYLRHLTKIGAILGGECWVDPEINSADQLQQGSCYFDFDFTPPTPAEKVTFRRHLTDEYFSNIFN